jgi:hypothetical protein
VNEPRDLDNRQRFTLGRRSVTVGTGDRLHQQALATAVRIDGRAAFAPLPNRCRGI